MKRYFKGTQQHIANKSRTRFFTLSTRASFSNRKHFRILREGNKKRKFVTYKCETDGKTVCVTSTGIGGPPASIVIEELANCGVKTFIRVGTTGAIQADIELLGDVIIP